MNKRDKYIEHSAVECVGFDIVDTSDPKKIEGERIWLGPFLFFSDAPGLPLPPLDDFKVAKHTRKSGRGKKERPNLRVVRMSRFREIADLPDLYLALFGKFVVNPSIG